VKDTSIIPQGPYCYTWIETPSKENNYVGKTNTCAYYQCRTINGVQIPWCNYLDMGGTPGDGDWQGWEGTNKPMEKLKAHFGSEDVMYDKLGLHLLFDMCKECGENNVDDENTV